MSADFITDFLIGGLSGTIAKTTMAPIERVKLLIQTQDANPLVLNGTVERYSGIGNCFSRVQKEQGFASFWRGNLTNCIRYFPTQAFNFAFKDQFKKIFPKPPKDDYMMSLAVNTLSGGCAGVGSLTIVYPLDYARTRLASDMGQGSEKAFNGLWDCMVKTSKGPKGILSLWNGFGISAVGIFPYRGAYFGVHDTLKMVNPYANESGALALGSKFAVAQFSAISAGYISYPLDTVRRRLQMQSEKPPAEWTYKGTGHCFSKILKEEGPTAFFKGAGANALRTVGAALVLVLYDEIKRELAISKAKSQA
jgi:solute carrier family 25 (adenine nucleotide translocator) protein 4/5/6/31